MIDNTNTRGNANKRLNYLLKTDNDKDVDARRILMFINWDSKVMADLVDDRFRGCTKKSKATFCVTTEIGPSPDMFLIIRRYSTDKMYTFFFFNGKFTMNTLF